MELLNIGKDIRDGGLEREEVPGFILWMIGKLFWFIMLVILIGACIVMAS